MWLLHSNLRLWLNHTCSYLQRAPAACSVMSALPNLNSAQQTSWGFFLVIWVLPTIQCIISCIISHAHHYVSEVSPSQNQNSSKRNPGKQAWPKQISTNIILHVLGEHHEEKVCHTFMWKLSKICSRKTPTMVSQHMLWIHFISAKQVDFVGNVFSWHFSHSRCGKSLQRKVSLFCYSGHQHQKIFPLLFWILLKFFNASNYQ